VEHGQPADDRQTVVLARCGPAAPVRHRAGADTLFGCVKQGIKYHITSL
jgi:hypothetical protein